MVRCREFENRMEMVMSGSNRHLRAVKGLADIISRLGHSKSRSPLNYIRTDSVHHLVRARGDYFSMPSEKRESEDLGNHEEGVGGKERVARS